MKLLSLFLLVGATASSASAQQVIGDTTKLQDRSVTATKVSAARGVSPTATTIISGDDLRARGITFVTDALHDVPGLVVVPNGSYGAVTSIFLRGGESDYVKVLVDGVPINQPGGSINLADLTTDNLDRIEIVRGPASVLYGSDAMTGVIQLFTRDGAKRPSGTASYWRGTFHNSLYDVGFGGRTGNLGLSGSWSDFKSDGTYAFNSKYHNQVATANLTTANPKSGTRYALTGRYGNSQANYPTDFSGAPVDSNQYTTNKSIDIGASAVTSFGRSALLSLQGFSSHLTSGFSNRPDSPGDSTDYGYDADRSSTTSRLGGDGRLDFTSSNGSILSIGAGYEREKEDQTSRSAYNFGFGPGTDTASFGAERNTKQVYGQGFILAGQSITLQFGGRLDDNSAFGNFFTWRGGAAFGHGRTRLFVSAGTAFKAPTFSELFAKGAYEVGNADLVPERSQNIEAGITLKNATGRFSIGLTAFKQKFRDLIQFIDAAPGATNYVNLGGVDSKGLEGTVLYHPNKGFNVTGHLTWLHTEVTDTGAASSAIFEQGQPLVRRPKFSGGITAMYHFGNGVLGGVLNYVGSRADVDYRPYPAVRTTLPAYHTIDLSVEQPFGKQRNGGAGWALMLRGENLFNVKFDQVVGFPGRGRTLFIGARSTY